MASGTDKPGAATIFEVAEAAGVSITTVSHVFSGKRPVGARTRERVEAAAARLAYQPRPAARALGGGRTMTLAVQFPLQGLDVLFNQFFSELVPAMSEAAVVRGYTFVLVPPDPSHDTYLQPLIERRNVDGAILLDPSYGDPFPAALSEAGVPFVSLGRTPGAPDAPRVDNDFAAIMRECVGHLRAAGFARPALLNFPGELSTLVEIEAVFRAAAGESATVIAAASEAAAWQAVAGMLEGDERPDAFICIDERYAAAVYRAASDAGVRIPDEIGVVALHDGIATRMEPPLTTVALFPARAGRALVELIDSILDGADPEPLTLVPFELRPRESTLRGASS